MTTHFALCTLSAYSLNTAFFLLITFKHSELIQQFCDNFGNSSEYVSMKTTENQNPYSILQVLCKLCICIARAIIVVVRVLHNSIHLFACNW